MSIITGGIVMFKFVIFFLVAPFCLLTSVLIAVSMADEPEKSGNLPVFEKVVPEKKAPNFNDKSISDKKKLLRKYKETGDCDICTKYAIEEKMETREFIRTLIVAGCSICEPINGAVDAEKDINKIIDGALEASAAPDVIAGCLIKGGVSAAHITQIFEEKELAGLSGIILPGHENDTLSPKLPGDNERPGGNVSPYKF